MAAVRFPDPKLKTIVKEELNESLLDMLSILELLGIRDKVSDQHSYCFNVDDDPKTFNEAIKSQDVAFWKEAINDVMHFTMGNNTWVLADLPDLQKKTEVARMSIIRLLIMLASNYNMIIHQMGVKTTFLNGELDEENSSYLGLRKKHRLNLKNDMPPRDKLEEEKARKCGKVFNSKTAKYGKIWYDEDVHDLRSVETEFPAIVFNDNLTSNETLSSEPTDNDYEKLNIPLFPSPKLKVSCFDDLDFFKDFENEFLAIFYNDALTSKSDFLTEPTLSPQHIDEFDLKDETSLSEYYEVEQNVLYFNDLFPFNIIYPDDLKSDKDNDDNEIDMIKSSRGNENTQGSNNLLEESHDKINKVFIMKSFVMELNLNIVAWNYLVNGMLFNLIKNLYVPFGIPFDPKRYYKYGDCTRMLRRPSYVFFTLLNLGKLVSKNGYSVSDMAPLPPREQRHLFLRYYGLEYSDQVIADFEERLERIHNKGEEIESLSFARDPVLRLCHRMTIHSIAGRSQAPEKSEALTSSGQFVAQLAKHFRLLIEERLYGLTVTSPALPIIDMIELALVAPEGGDEDEEIPQAIPPPPRTQVGKLSRYTSNPGTQHWQAIQRVLKYLKKTMDYSLIYIGYPSVLEGYIDASWISNTEDNSSTSGWVFLLATAGKEAEWLRNLIIEIPLWSKHIAPILIRCDSAATLANAYNQMYNRKPRHLGVRHRMIRELIKNGVLSIEFLRPNGEALRKCILSDSYKPTTMLVQATEATDDSPAIPEHTTVETPANMSPENKAHFQAEKEAIHLILTGIGYDIYSTVDACQTA
uniref:Zinc finger, CCHC-type n=1 Tax=Tanacetum cinerariifolium TaxID=118510 RepID=A0A6L2N303_TANCI|nr:zinc finger, CCHC-type [Tanacetum cinerariifolium]